MTLAGDVESAMAPAEETPAAEADMTPLYRIVNPTELKDIEDDGVFRNPDVIDGHTVFLEGKYFSLT